MSPNNHIKTDTSNKSIHSPLPLERGNSMSLNNHHIKTDTSNKSIHSPLPLERGKGVRLTFLLITILFFMWGFAHSMLDVLNKHFQVSLNISMTQAALVQNAVYGGYFLMAIPAGKIISRFGYKAGVLIGLVLFSLGALLFVPSSLLSSPLLTFYFFVFSLFVIGCGLTCLETSANPYATVLGDKEGAERRINFAQSFNGLGWILGPLVGLFLFREGAENNDVVIPYAVIGVIVLFMAVVFSRVPLPEVGTENDAAEENATKARTLWQHRNFKFGILVLMLYVAAQTGVNSFFINYTTDPTVGISTTTATLILAFGCMGLFMVGRLCGSWLMSRIRAERILTFCALGATLATFGILLTGGMIGTVALFFVYLFESIMFPTIFALSIRGLGSKQTKQASSYLIMSIVGGAVAPTIMALIGERSGLAQAFIVPLICYIAILLYGMKYKTLK